MLTYSVLCCEFFFSSCRLQSSEDMMWCTLALLTALCAAMCASENVTLTFLDDPMAVCVDGSRAAYYVRRTKDSARFATKWMLYVGGGAWCWTPENCYARSSTWFGSSNEWARSMPREELGAGLLSENCTINPTFCQYNFLSINYCDGNSFSGMLAEPLEYNRTKLYLRGKYILDAVVDAMITEGAWEATHFVFTGGSAGGLAVFLHADYVVNRVRQKARVLEYAVALPVSGFFLDEANIEFHDIFPSHLREAYYLHNASYGVSQACLSQYSQHEQWRCNFAEYSFPFSAMTVPMFVLNSKTDFWQLTCIRNVMQLVNYSGATYNDIINGNCSAVPGYTCLNWGGYRSCGDTEMLPALSYQRSFLQRVFTLSPFRQGVNGAYITSCYTHCEALDDNNYMNIRVGGVSMPEAIGAWYQDVLNGGSSSSNSDGLPHTHIDCPWTDAAPYRCNPTCPE